MARVIAVANQKGGVAKTTTVHALGSALVERDRSVLLVDLDPQASLTYACAVSPDELELTIHDVMMGRAELADLVWETAGPDLVPSSIDLAGSEVHLLTRTGREFALRKALAPVVPRYEFVFIDCPPSLGILTINGLTAAGEVLIPMHADRLSWRGVGQFLETIDDVRSFTNPDLAVTGVVVTMFDSRTRLGREVVADVHESFGLRVLEPPIPRSVKVAEAPALGVSVLKHASSSRAATAYRELAANLEQA